ncbi:MAG TPA: energy transducer TonB, partial [Terriglobales bacterium]
PRSTPTPVAANIAAAGAFDLPSGSGRGNGTGGPTPGVVVSAGFGNGVATAGRRSGGPVQKSGFDAEYAFTDSHKPAADIEPTSTPVAILYKPKPAYTEAGRKQGIDGEVRLEVLFSAAGQVHVLRVLQGLGYGLDEQAVKAAEQIRFKPASHAGQPVDSTAVVHIIFQLAS